MWGCFWNTTARVGRLCLPQIPTVSRSCARRLQIRAAPLAPIRRRSLASPTIASLTTCLAESVFDAFLQARFFELCKCGEDSNGRGAGGLGHAETILGADEVDAKSLKFSEHTDEVVQQAPETV